MELTHEEEQEYRELGLEFGMLQMHLGSLQEYTRWVSPEFVDALKAEANRTVLRIVEIEPQLLELEEKQGGRG